ncbi:unnamed protein product [Mytilus edulis]|uniref:CIDE-N domain-containing protein n=1 Tax=Mytilus edulis TaxID=6550 RepID=A0A8S3U6K1_MYTED|nr:unnamed protein product [Mytilus edulis]
MDLWPIAISKLVLEDVGTEVDSMYFETLPDNCLEMILSDVQVWSQPSSSSSSGQTGDHSNAFRREFRQYFARQFKIIRVLNEEPEESGFQFSEIQNIYNDIFHNNSCEYADNEENETPENTDLHFDDFGLEKEDEENYEFEEESLDFVGMLYDGAEISSSSFVVSQLNVNSFIATYNVDDLLQITSTARTAQGLKCTCQFYWWSRFAADVREEPSRRTELSTTEDIKLQQLIIQLYNESSDRNAKIQLLSMVSDLSSKKHCRTLFQGSHCMLLTQPDNMLLNMEKLKYAFAGVRLPKKEKFTRQRIDKGKLDHALDFFFGPTFHQAHPVELFTKGFFLKCLRSVCLRQREPQSTQASRVPSQSIARWYDTSNASRS